jgi:hypothetical protein
MASEDKKSKTAPAPKSEAAVKNAAVAKKSDAVASKDKAASGADAPKTDAGEKTTDAPANYSRGEGQKPVSKAYKENWNAIYGKKKKKKR